MPGGFSGASGSSGVRPFGWRDKIGYMCGDFGTDFMFLLASSWFMIFYTKVMGIPGAVVGTLFLLARVLDAFMDVTVGVIVDRAKDHPGGKFRTVMMRFTAPLVIFSFLMYQTFSIDSAMWMRVVYMSVTYIIWCFFYSCVNIPFGSMASTISPDSDDRTSLSTMRSMGGTIAGLVLSVVAPLVIYQTDASGNQVIRGGENTQTFAIVAGIVSVSAFIGYLVCYFNVCERVHPDTPDTQKDSPDRSPMHMIANAFSSRSMIGIICGALCLLIAQLFTSQLITYVYVDCFDSAALASISGLLGTLVMFAVVPFVKPLSKRFGRKSICACAALIGALSMLILFVIHTDNGVVFLIGATLMSFSLMGFNLVIWAMITDVIDDIEVTRGTREEATCFSCYSFARKIGQAIAGELAGMSLGWIGYQSGTTAVQTEATKAGLYSVATLVPGVFFLLTFVFIVVIYPLNRNRVAYNVELLRVKRQGLSAQEAKLVVDYEGITPDGLSPERTREWPDPEALRHVRALAEKAGVAAVADKEAAGDTGKTVAETTDKTADTNTVK